MGGKRTIAVSLCSERDKEGDKTVFAQFVEWVSPLDAVDVLLECVRPQFGSSRSWGE